MASDQEFRGEPERGQDIPLDMSGVLTAEFEYIAQTAFQANEDRARVTNLYLITLGGLVATVLGANVAGGSLPGMYWILVVLFLLLAADSVLTLLQLARLRLAWGESLAAMNQIKEFCQDRYPELETAFRWKTKTIPAMDNPRSVGLLLALQVAMLGGVALGVAIYLTGLCCQQPLLVAAIPAGVVFAVGQVLAYRWVLDWRPKWRKKRASEQPASGSARPYGVFPPGTEGPRLREGKAR